MNKRMIAFYLIISFTLAYLVWGGILVAQELNWFQYGTPLSLLLVVVGGNAPAVAALSTVKKFNKEMTLKIYLANVFTIKQGYKKYLIMLLFVVVFFLVPALTGGLLADRPPFMGGTQTQESVPLIMTIIVSPLFFFLGGSEEIGWRYLLQPELEKRFSFTISSIITGLIWTFWHIPLFFIVGSAQNSTEFTSFLISCMGLAFASAAIFRVTKSVWLSVLFHCLTNSLQGTWALSPSLVSNISTSISLIIISLLVVGIADRYSSDSNKLKTLTEGKKSWK